MLSNEIRQRFLEFFKSKGHEIIPSDSLVPRADPTLLFTSAGMNQFKEQFLGHNITYKRAASSQKCLRTADLDKVGKTPSHHTFFEMLGNFSFGDYFKKEAILWAWEFMTEVLGIGEDKLWVSVYEEDEESYSVWLNLIKVPKEKLVKLGAEENFWPSNAALKGSNGPCGPCSEIFYDWGKGVGCGKEACNPSCDCGRFVEVWNLVFTQFDRKEGGLLEPLPTKNIDTGMGLERITALLQGVKTNFESDLFAPIIEEIKPHNPKLSAENLKTIADHIRAATFAISDGVAPSNEERGYVIRKLIRRAYLRGGLHKPFLYNIVPRVVEIMKGCYPELLTKREEISLIVKEEEERFENTLTVAVPILDKDLDSAKENMLDGEKIFMLVDTYGLPIEVIENRARKRKIELDINGFGKLMEEARELSRKKSKLEEDIFALNLFAKAPVSAYSGKMPLTAKIVFMVRGKNAIEIASVGETVELMTDPHTSLFYAEGGGQLGDTGTIKSEKGLLQILNTVRVDNKVIHIAKVTEGMVAIGDSAILNLDAERKKDIAKNHTATHLLQSALRKVLGEHVHQAGSLVAEDRLRFDFTHIKKLTDREIEKVESIVNEHIKKCIKVEKEEKPLEEAKAEGAIALFGEKYAKSVIVVSAGDFSKEVCGGTHVDNTKEIGLFKIIRESSVASGIRRIEALTSGRAREWQKENERFLRGKEEALKKKEEEKALAREKLKNAEEKLDLILKRAEVIKGVKVVIEKLEAADIGILRSLSDEIRSKEKSFFVLFASVRQGKANLVLSITEDLVSSGLNASTMIKDIARIIEGSGGGRPDFAQAGGGNIKKLNEAIGYAKKLANGAIEGVK